MGLSSILFFFLGSARHSRLEVVRKNKTDQVLATISYTINSRGVNQEEKEEEDTSTKTIPEKPSIYFDLLYIATPGNEKKSKKKYKVQLFSRKDIPKRRKRKGVLPRHDVDIDWDECNEQGEKLLQKWYKEHGEDAYMDLSDVFDEYEY